VARGPLANAIDSGFPKKLHSTRPGA
jgi:hypothetical protein